MSKLDTLFEGQDLTQEFKTKIETIIESVKVDVESEQKAIFEQKLAEETTKLTTENDVLIEAKLTELDEKANKYFEDEVMPVINDYLAEGISKFVKENEIAIANNMKVELAESLLTGLVGLAESHNIEIPENSFDIVKSKELELAEATKKLDESIDEVIQVKKENEKLERKLVLSKVAKNLTESEAEKLATTSEKLSFLNESSFTESVSSLKESLFVQTEPEKEPITENIKPVVEPIVESSSWLKNMIAKSK